MLGKHREPERLAGSAVRSRCLGWSSHERSRLLCAVGSSVSLLRSGMHVIVTDRHRLAAPYCYAQTIDIFDFSIPLLVLLFVEAGMFGWNIFEG